MTAVEVFANQPQTTVSSGGTGPAPSPGTPETWTVASSSSFPAASNIASPPTQFHVADIATGKTSEIIAVTNVSGTTWTVTRGAEGSIPVQHSPGFTIVQVASAGALGGMLQAGNNLSDVASRQAALDTLAGAVTSGDYLRGSGTHVSMAAIQAGDVPGVGGVTVTGTPANGQVLTASSGTTATWQPTGAGGIYIIPSGDVTGAADTANLQNALNTCRTAGGGSVIGQPGGTFYINAALRIGSGTTLNMTDCTIVLKSNTSMAENYSSVAAATASDAALTSGQHVITTSLGASAVNGQTVTVAGAGGTTHSTLCGLVSAHTSNTITFTDINGATLNAGQTVSGATVKLYNRDSNVTIKGGYWQAGSVVTSGFPRLFIFSCDGFTVAAQGVSATTGGFLHAIYNATSGNVTARNLSSTTTTADGVHVGGPVYNLVVPEVSGTTGDDGFAITAGTADDVSSGNVVGVTVGTVNVTSSNANVFKVIAGAGTTVDEVLAFHILGSGAQYGAWIGDDSSNAAFTGGTYGSIDAGVIEAGTGNGTMLFLVNPVARQIKADLRTNTLPSPVAGCSVYATSTGGTSGTAATIQELILTGAIGSNCQQFLHIAATTMTVNHLVLREASLLNSGGASSAFLGNAGTVVTADLTNCRTAWSGGNGILASNSGTLTALNITGGYASLYQLVSDSSAQPLTVTFSGGFATSNSNSTGVGWIADFTGNAAKTVIFAGCTLALNTDQGYAISVSTASLTVRGDQIAYSGPATFFHRAGSETIEVRAPQLQCDLSVLTRAGNGDMAYNTNAGLACGTGICISSGSGSAGSWKNLSSGSTY